MVYQREEGGGREEERRQRELLLGRLEGRRGRRREKESVMCDLIKHSFVLPSLYRMYVNVYNCS